MFTSILDGAVGLTVANALLCLGVSFALGGLIAFVYTRQKPYTKNFVITLTLLPALVQAVILMVNGNLGTSVAVLGAFSLVRFRSVPGNSREILCIFFAMAVGLAVGTGYLLFAALMTVAVGAVLLFLFYLPVGREECGRRDLRITIPENLNYTQVFDDLFPRYLSDCRLVKVKTSNLGSMYDLQYSVVFRKEGQEKELIDEIRCRNGNLTVSCCLAENAREEL